MSGNILLNGESLTVEEMGTVAIEREEVRIAEGARENVERGWRLVEEAIREKRVVYGVDTGFGGLAGVSIDEKDLAALQLNLIRSHAAGTGPFLSPEVIRAILLAKANALLKGLDGVRWNIPATLISLLARDIVPRVPSIGSLGASGDLAPLAHISLALVGEGDVWWKGEVVPAAEALEKEGIPPLVLGPKEGLGLINGTQGIAAVLSLALYRAKRILDHAMIATAFTTEALQGTDAAWDEKLYRARPHPGGIAIAKALNTIMQGSGIRSSHTDCGRVQDAYSIRCAPTVLGAVQDVIARCVETTECELNSATGNPLCFPEENEIISGGNFHGEPVAFAADFLAIAFSEVASIAERRVARLVDPKLSGLPAYLAGNPGLESGFMIVHYTAAALVAENKVLAHPASVDSIPTSGNQEDHVSMGFHGAKKALQIVENVERVVAIELLAGAEGLEHHRPLKSSPPLERALEVLRAVVSARQGDRPLNPDLDNVIELMRNGAMVEAAGVNRA